MTKFTSYIRLSITEAALRHAHKRSNTERGHKTKLAKGEVIGHVRGWTIKAGVDLRDVARGGTPTTKRNRLTISRKGSYTTYYRNNKEGIDGLVAAIERITKS